MRKLHVGYGPRMLKGWINIEYMPPPQEGRYEKHALQTEMETQKEFLQLDVACEPLPFKSNSVDLIFHENFIEHLDQKGMFVFLAECFRVLKPGAIHRIHTPDLLWSQKHLGKPGEGFKGVYQEGWSTRGHKNLLTRGYLREVAELIGFTIVFQKREVSLDETVSKEFRHISDCSDNATIFADLIKPLQTLPRKRGKTEHCTKRKVLDVGGNNRDVGIPAHYQNWEHLLLDLDPSGKPDFCMDARKLHQLKPGQFDAVYSSHSLEHFYRADVPLLLQGMHHVIHESGFIEIHVPDIEQLLQQATAKHLDIDDMLYEVEGFGPITVHDYIFGYDFSNDDDGRFLCLHKTAFSQKSLERLLKANGFPFVFAKRAPMELQMLGFKNKPGQLANELFGIC